eukprot:IDg9020t1
MFWLTATAVMALFPFAVLAKTACVGGNDYMCMDWTFGSQKLSYYQYVYKTSLGLKEDIHFGMGSYGSGKGNLGKCFKFYLNTLGSSGAVVFQVTNEGVDIGRNQVDMQMGAGGFGIFNVCAGPTNKNPDSKPCQENTGADNINAYPQFDGTSHSSFGERCGGQKTKSQCDSVPLNPSEWNGALPKFQGIQEPNLRTLCRRAFDRGVRKSNNNPKITRGKRIKCPNEMIAITNLKRTDEAQWQINQDPPMVKNGQMGKLTSTMDCCAPSAAHFGNTPNAHPKHPRVIPCRRNGYTRVGSI